MRNLITIVLIFFIQIGFPQKNKKDTLVFKYDEKYLKQFEEKFYLLENSYDFSLYFKNIKSFNSLKLNSKPLNLKKYIHSKMFYDNFRNILMGPEFIVYFGNYDVFLKKKKELIQVIPIFEIE